MPFVMRSSKNGGGAIQSDWYPSENRTFGHRGTQTGRMSWEEWCQVATSRGSTKIWEKVPDQTLPWAIRRSKALPATWSQTPSLWNCGTVHFSCLSHSAWLLQPQKTHPPATISLAGAGSSGMMLNPTGCTVYSIPPSALKTKTPSPQSGEPQSPKLHQWRATLAGWKSWKLALVRRLMDISYFIFFFFNIPGKADLPPNSTP